MPPSGEVPSGSDRPLPVVTDTDRPQDSSRPRIADLKARLAEAEARADAAEAQVAALRTAAAGDDLSAHGATLQDLMEAVPAYVFIALDPECRTMACNRRAESLLRVGHEANVSKSAPAGERPTNFQEVRDGVPVDPADLPMQRAARGEYVTDAEIEIRFGNGDARVILGNAVPLLTAEGVPHGSLGAFVDITERRRAQSALRDNVNTIEAMLHSLPVAVTLSRLPDGAFVDVNEAYEQLVGIPRDEILGRNSLELGLVRDTARRRLIMDQIEDRGGIPGAEIRLSTRTGGDRNVLAYSTTCDWRGQRCILSCVLDITERKAHDAAIEDLNRRLQRAMAETNHRVKNNLQVIAALIDIVQMAGGETVPMREVNRIGRQVRALASVHDVLTSEVERTPDAQHLSARTAFERLLPLLRETLRERTLTYRVADVPVTTRQCSALAVLINECVSNAAKHGASQVDLVLEVDACTARLRVCDNGPGFPAGFNPRVDGHTGVGLITNLSEWDLQGRVTFANRPEGGALVEVTFAVDTAAA